MAQDPNKDIDMSGKKENKDVDISSIMKKLDRKQLSVSNDMSNRKNNQFMNFGLFSSETQITRTKELQYSIFGPKISEQERIKLLNDTSLNNHEIDRAIGSVVGMGLGDAFGAPLEFRSILACRIEKEKDLQTTNNQNNNETNGNDIDIPNANNDNKQDESNNNNNNNDNKDNNDNNDNDSDSDDEFQIAELIFDPSSKKLVYKKETNKFRLKRGQWTDDASMGLCMADSLIINKCYHGSDIRIRFYNWWHNGYNNAFKKESPKLTNDKVRSHCGSVGLGGNISQSIFSMNDFEFPNEIYQVSHNREDSGNGSIMRLSPIPVFFHKNQEIARKYASQSSFTTHPGYIAAESCRLMTFIIISAIHAPNVNNDDNVIPKENVKKWLDLITQEYVNVLKNEITDLTNKLADIRENNDNETREEVLIVRQINAKKLHQKLINGGIDENTTDPSPKELNWNWKLSINKYKKEMIKTYYNRRGDTYDINNKNGKFKINRTKYGRKMYNGYPISETYWGSYCMDGLAMGLHSVYNGNNISSSIQIATNLLGDSDSTASITGQIAGSIYGYQSLLSEKTDLLGFEMNKKLNFWDEYGFALRGLLLYELGNKYSDDKENINKLKGQVKNNFDNAFSKQKKKFEFGWNKKAQE